VELFAAKDFTDGTPFHSFEQPIGQSAQLHLVRYLARVYSAAESELLVWLLPDFATARGGEINMGASSKPQTISSDSNGLNGDLDPDYVPNENEAFMNDTQLLYFEKQLVNWRNEILSESQGTLNQLQDGPIREPDLNDRASSETDWSIELRTRDRQRKLIAKIDAALRRIKEGEYGYCQVTGEPISLARLRARPVATMTLEAQERHERQERVSRDD
jgi:DnaK suppressor protein